MTIIKIDPGKNGYHDNQTIYGDIPNSWIPTGWALIPEELGTPETLENYPFGEITVEEIGGIPTVTSWTPLPVPDPVPEPVPESYTSEDLLSALLGLEDAGNAGGGRLREALEPQAIRGVALFLSDGSVAYIRTGVGA